MATRISGPAPILTLDEAKAHLRVDFDDDNPYIQSLIEVVTATLDGPQGTLGRMFAEQEWAETYADLGQSVTLPIGPVISVTSITHSGGLITEFELNKSGSGWVASAPDSVTWPSVSGDTVVQFKVGLSPIPEPLKMAALLHIGTFYENRESAVIGTITALLPNGYHALLAPYRLWSA